MEQQNTLRAWQAGGFKGLLSDPDLPGLSLSEASTVVFLSPQLTDVQFTQATGRVVRQGSFHKNVRVIVLGAAGNQETEDAEKIERFCQIACEHSSGTSGPTGFETRAPTYLKGVVSASQWHFSLSKWVITWYYLGGRGVA